MRYGRFEMEKTQMHCGQPIGSSRQFVRWGVALFVMGLFVASWFVRVPGNALARGLVAFVPVVVLMAAVELMAKNKLSKSERWRVRRVEAGGGSCGRSLGTVLLNIMIGSVALLVLGQTRHPVNFGMAALRIVSGVAFLYAVAGVLVEGCRVCLQTKGYSLPVVHRTPIAARSVGEFWARRWNLVVSDWLRTFVFRPVARRGGPGAGLLGSFAVSGFFHAWPMLIALGAGAAASTMAFFLIHGALVIIENRLQVERWPLVGARAWTLLLMLGSSPLYIDPGLRLFGF